MTIDYTAAAFDVLEERTYLTSLDAIGAIFAFFDSMLTLFSAILLSMSANEFYEKHPAWVLDSDMRSVVPAGAKSSRPLALSDTSSDDDSLDSLDVHMRAA